MKQAFNGRALWLAAVAITVFVGSAVAQQAMNHEQMTPPAGQSGSAMPMDANRMGDMMAQCQRMMADMRASDQKLDDLLAKMNTARGNDRIDAIAAAVNELAARQKAAGAGMMSMHGMMMMMGDHTAHHPADK